MSVLDTMARLELEELYQVLRTRVWCAETSYDPGYWKDEKEGDGQCYVTALLVKTLYGGKVLRAETEDGSIHYWNELPNGIQIDLTRKCLRPYPELKGKPRNLINWKNKRYQLLLKRYDDFLKNEGKQE